MADKKQIEMGQEIASYNLKKDYYDILGITKTANQSQIKKAYRTLALRFHPDKNSMPGAVDVFKKITNAYSTLTNPDKKAHYDRFGPQEPQVQRQQARSYASARQDQQFQQFNDIYRAFFGQDVYQDYRYQNRNQVQKNNIGVILVFVIFFIIYKVAPLLKSSQPYSLYPSNQYKVRRITQKFNVQYYVGNKFFQIAKQNKYYVKEIQLKINRAYVNMIKSKCQEGKNKKRIYQQYAKRQRITSIRNQYLQNAKKVQSNYCQDWIQIQRRYFSYLNQIGF